LNVPVFLFLNLSKIEYFIENKSIYLVERKEPAGYYLKILKVVDERHQQVELTGS